MDATGADSYTLRDKPIVRADVFGSATMRKAPSERRRSTITPARGDGKPLAEMSTTNSYAIARCSMKPERVGKHEIGIVLDAVHGSFLVNAPPQELAQRIRVHVLHVVSVETSHVERKTRPG